MLGYFLFAFYILAFFINVCINVSNLHYSFCWKWYYKNIEENIDTFELTMNLIILKSNEVLFGIIGESNWLNYSHSGEINPILK